MNERWVVNASPIILLAKAGLEHLFTKMADEVLLPVLGSLGVILRSKRRGLLSSAAGAFAALRDSGLYLDNATVAAALRSVGEQWGSP